MGQRLGLCSNGTSTAACYAGTSTTRGFTNQEEIYGIGLVNLNARIYDPVLGRFMSADSVVQDLFAPQTLNRYSYAGNNPLSFTDPTGHCYGVVSCFFAISTFGASDLIMEPLLRSVPILGNLLTIAAGASCGPFGPICAAWTAAGVAGAEGGRAGDVLKAFALTFAEAEAFQGVHFLKEGLGFPKDYAQYSSGQLLASAAMHGTVGRAARPVVANLNPVSWLLDLVMALGRPTVEAASPSVLLSVMRWLVVSHLSWAEESLQTAL